MRPIFRVGQADSAVETITTIVEEVFTANDELVDLAAIAAAEYESITQKIILREFVSLS